MPAASALVGKVRMGKINWIFPSQALAEMKRKLPLVEPDALAIWARDGQLRAKAREVLLYDGFGYVNLDKPQDPKAAWWCDVWYGITDPCSLPNRNRLNWTAAELTVLREADHSACEEITVKGLEFNRPDLLRCIRAARGEREPAARAHPTKVRAWVDEQVQLYSLENLTERRLKTEATTNFPGLRGAPTQAVERLRELRTKAKTAETEQVKRLTSSS